MGTYSAKSGWRVAGGGAGAVPVVENDLSRGSNEAKLFVRFILPFVALAGCRTTIVVYIPGCM